MNKPDNPLTDLGRPCVTLGVNKIKARYKAHFCLYTATGLLEESHLFTRLKMSERLGLIKGCGVPGMLLFKDGTVELTGVNNSDEAYRLLVSVGRALLGSTLCPRNDNQPAKGCTNTCPGGCTIMKMNHVPLVNENIRP